MNLQDRIASLKSKHAALDEMLQEESRRPNLDSRAVAEMKRKKLAIKDELRQMGAI
ncbi:MAG: DUF465 domain-containing protein [Rhodospirillales bacterium]|nr:DUF465 domain-containing protein [Rhodospirillales bacterium]